MVYKGCMILKTRGIPYYFPNFDTFHLLIIHPKNTSLMNFFTKFPKTRGIPCYFENFDVFHP